ncbi:MAG: hypothetical protein LBO09_03005 [Candidatus Peribacteria bacterium]|jgi:hypothetical protein|nr:hypothetical protein [Candidatus Peribacteria bacterium]
MQGYIDDPTLFYRFQNIQHQNLLQSIKRLYTYDDFERGNAPEQASRAPILSGDSANRILYLMRNYKITVEDL